ncbi:MAG: hypothetical protein QNJ20_00055 [Paracoccaceae bacterium]|nr:hypothetical protein [Paracoccaceae bacterium]
MFFPAYSRKGAALLRIYNVASVMRDMGWDIHVLPWKLTLPQRLRCLAALRPDAVLMQGTRHPLNRPAFFPGERIVLDLDDCDFHLPQFAASVEQAMPQVAAVIAGSEYIADWCRNAGAAETRVVWTGATVTKQVRPPQAGRAPVVAWAQTRPMTYRNEADLVRTVMARVAAICPGVTLRLYDRADGDDPAFAQSFEQLGLKVEWQKRMGYDAFLRSFDDVALGLAPLMEDDPFCRGKSFGKVLAYLDRGIPVVASDIGEPGLFFSPDTGSLCRTVEEWTENITWLLSDDQARQGVADAAFSAFQKKLSVETSAERVARVLTGVIGGNTGHADLSI